MKTFALFSLGLFALLCVAAARADQPKSDRTLNATVAAAGLHKVALSAGVGSARIEPSTDGSVHIAVRIEPKDTDSWFVKWIDEDAVADLTKAELNKTVHDGVLEISLTLPNEGSDEDKRFEEHWTIRMPPALALRADMQVGEVRIEDIGGGVDAETRVGEMRISVPHGSVHARVKVGDLKVTTGASAYKSITLDTSIGDAEVHGLDVDGQAHGDFLGKHVSLEGHGTDEFVLASKIGQVELTFSEQP